MSPGFFGVAEESGGESAARGEFKNRDVRQRRAQEFCRSPAAFHLMWVCLSANSNRTPAEQHLGTGQIASHF